MCQHSIHHNKYPTVCMQHHQSESVKFPAASAHVYHLDRFICHHITIMNHIQPARALLYTKYHRTEPFLHQTIVIHMKFPFTFHTTQRTTRQNCSPIIICFSEIVSKPNIHIINTYTNTILPYQTVRCHMSHQYSLTFQIERYHRMRPHMGSICN